MTSFVTWIPFFFALYYTFFKSPQRALYSVYIPVLLLLPAIFTAKTSGFPKLTFHQTAVIPIVLGMLLTLHKWKWSFTDFIIALYVLFAVYAETRMDSLSLGINYLAISLCDIVGPYLIGKELIHQKKMTIPIAKRIVFLIFVNILFAPYEWRMGISPLIKFPDFFFPDQDAWGWGTPKRYGFVRLTGAFMSPIFLATLCNLALLLHYWLYRKDFWERKFKYTQIPYKSALIAFVLLFGLFFTFSRGPWLACVVGFFMSGLAFSNHPRKSFIIRLGIAVVVILLAMQFFAGYRAINPIFSSNTQEESTLIYRANLWAQYKPLLDEEWYWGWGSVNFPKVATLQSVDQGYLYIALTHGMLSLFVFVFLMTWITFRIVKKAFYIRKAHPISSSFAFICVSILTMFLAVFFTVFIGLQIEVVLFLVLGWMEGFIKTKPSDELLSHA